MSDKSIFEYGGYHFIPERQFTPGEDDFFKIAKHQKRDLNLGFCEKGYGPCRYEYSHASFYDASPDKTCDLFRCVENGKLYLPCEHDLQEYMEDNAALEPDHDMPDEDTITEDDVRKAGDYEIIQSITLGDREIVLGENLRIPADERYMCAFCRHTNMALFYEEVMAYNSYLEAIKDFADHLTAQARKMRKFTADGKLNPDVILSIIQEEKPNQVEQFKIPKERISRFFTPGTPAQKIEDTIVKALEYYRKRQRDMER